MKAATATHPPKVPPLKHHKASGQGYVRIDGRVIYLGKHDLPETQQKYHRLVAEWLAGGRQLPVEADQITIIELCARFWKHAQDYYRKPNGEPGKELHHFKQALKPLRKLYGHMQAVDFGPLALRVVRDAMIKNGWCRRHVNHNIGRIRRMFRWATENEIVPGSIFHAIQAVAGLKRGRSEARESEPVRPVPMADINAVRPYVSRQVWTMIQLQLHTAARGGEIVRIRPCDIDRSGKIWTYTLSEHKTAHYGYERRIYIGPRGQEAVRPFLLRSPDAFCLSPAEAEEERRKTASQARRTPLSCGNRPGTNRKVCPRKQPGDHYTPQGYARAIRYACEKAFSPPEHLARREGETITRWKKRLTNEQKAELREWQKKRFWHPHQLRHNAATYLRKEFGLETARIILGHRSAAITEVYAEADQQKAVDAMLKIG
jgi:integrase